MLAVVVSLAALAAAPESRAYVYTPVAGGDGARTVNQVPGLWAYEGGGAYLFNSPGGFYMGRMWDGDIFDAVEQARSEKFAGQIYRWGRSGGRGGEACLWIGPRASTPQSATSGDFMRPAGREGSRAGCDDGQKQSLATSAARFGADFNCPLGDASAGGPVQTWVEQGAAFHYNVRWRVTGAGAERYYTAGEAQPNPGGPVDLDSGHAVKYRYTSGEWAVVYARGYGWGFVPASAVHVVFTNGHRWGRHGLESSGSREAACGDRSDYTLEPAHSPVPTPEQGMQGFTFKGGDTLRPGQSLRVGDYIMSEDVRSVLVMQGDGNLVVYSSGLKPLWSSDTAGTAAVRAELRPDGELVLLDGAGNAVWGTGASAGPSRLTLPNDGNLELRSESGVVSWASGRLAPGEPPVRIGGWPFGRWGDDRDRYLRSADGRYALVVDADGGVAVFGPGYHRLSE